MAKKRLFYCAVEAIKWHWPVRPLTSMELIFFLLAGLSLLVGLSMDPNCTKNERDSRNDDLNNGMDIGNRVDMDNKVDISDGVDNKILKTDGLPPTNLYRTESESCSDHCNMRDMVGKEISFTEEIQPKHSNSNRFRSKCHSDNTLDSNRNIGNGLGNKELWLDNFEGSEYLDS